MRHEVIITPTARKDLAEAYLWFAENAPRSANAWLDEMERAVGSLADSPGRCPLAPEADEIGREIRQLMCGRGRGLYRIVFIIQKRIVRVIHVRHGARDRLTPDDLPPTMRD